MIHYRLLKFYVRQGTVFDKVHEIVSFGQSRWLEKCISFITQKRNLAANGFEKDFNKVLDNAFCGKTMENVRKRVKLKSFGKDDKQEITQQQSELTFKAIHKSYTNYDTYTFKQIEIFMPEEIFSGFAILELSKFLMYETHYDKLHFGENYIQIP